MTDIIPSFYSQRKIGSSSSQESSSNYVLRTGEILDIIYPDDTRSVSKRFIEYNVFVEHKENNTGHGRLYHNCYQMSPLGGLADKSLWTLRIDPNNVTAQKNNLGKSGVGSKALVLCIDGSYASAVILGGIRNDQDKDDETIRKNLGHHGFFIFNGVKFQVNDDGSCQLSYQGKTKADGKWDNSVKNVTEDSLGTNIKIEANGNVSVSTNGDKEQILVDHVKGKITVKSDKICLGGPNANENVLLGQKWKALMSDFIDAVCNITVFNSGGNTSPPLNASQIQALKNRLDGVLSDFVYTQKKP